MELKRVRKVDLSKLPISKDSASNIEGALLPLIKKFPKIVDRETVKNNRWGWVNLQDFTDLLSESRSINEKERRGELKPEDVIVVFHSVVDMHEQTGFSTETAKLNYDAFLLLHNSKQGAMALNHGLSCFIASNDFVDDRTSYFVPAGWAKTVFYLWRAGVRSIVKVPHRHEISGCSLIGSIRCDELPEGDMYIGIVPVSMTGWPILFADY